MQRASFQIGFEVTSILKNADRPVESDQVVLLYVSAGTDCFLGQTQTRWRKSFLDLKRSSSLFPWFCRCVHTSREPRKVYMSCKYAALLTNQNEYMEETPNKVIWLFLNSILPVFLQSPMYKGKSYRVIYVLLLKSDATVLALPSIDGQWKYSLHQFLGTFSHSPFSLF